MTEIKIEPKKKSTWQWIIAAIVIIVLAIILILSQVNQNDNVYNYDSTPDTEQQGDPSQP